MIISILTKLNVLSKFSDWFYSSYLFGDTAANSGFAIRKYAVCLLLGILTSYFVCTKEGERMGIKKDDVLTVLIITIPLCVLGGEIIYMFTDGENTIQSIKNQYGNNFFVVIYYLLLYLVGFRGGGYEGITGMAMGGVIIVAFIMIFVACRWKHWKKENFLDEVAPGLLLAQIIGRWGNFFNQEAYGKVVGGWTIEGTKLIPTLTLSEQFARLQSFGIPKWIINNMGFSRGSYYFGVVNGSQFTGYVEQFAYYHPTFLYESLLNLVGLIIYFIARRKFKKMKSGSIAAGYLIWYGVVRFIIEHLRTDSLYLSIGGNPVKFYYILCPIMVILGIALLLYLNLRKGGELYQDAIKKGLKLATENKENEEEIVNVSLDSHDNRVKETVVSSKDKENSSGGPIPDDGKKDK